jgi:hypothetical protein
MTEIDSKVISHYYDQGRVSLNINNSHLNINLNNNNLNQIHKK